MAYYYKQNLWLFIQYLQSGVVGHRRDIKHERAEAASCDEQCDVQRKCDEQRLQELGLVSLTNFINLGRSIYFS